MEAKTSLEESCRGFDLLTAYQDQTKQDGNNHETLIDAICDLIAFAMERGDDLEDLESAISSKLTRARR